MGAVRVNRFSCDTYGTAWIEVDATYCDRCHRNYYWPTPSTSCDQKCVSQSVWTLWMALITIICISVIAVFTKGMVRRLLLLLGLVAFLFYLLLTANVMGFWHCN